MGIGSRKTLGSLEDAAIAQASPCGIRRGYAVRIIHLRVVHDDPDGERLHGLTWIRVDINALSLFIPLSLFGFYKLIVLKEIIDFLVTSGIGKCNVIHRYFTCC